MLCSIVSSICKYTINVIDLRSQEPWEAKSMHVFFVDLLTGKKQQCQGVLLTFFL